MGEAPGCCIIKPVAGAATVIRVKTRWNEGDERRRMSAPGETTDFLRRQESAVINRISKSISFY